MLTSKADHVYHVWINRRQDARRKEGKPTEGDLYDWKSAMQAMGYMEQMIRQAFTGTLRDSHKQCSMSEPEPVEQNVAKCYLGCNVAECPILRDLGATIDELADQHGGYYKPVDDERYKMMAMTCAWHMLMAGNGVGDDAGAFIDWNEGAIQDTSDRMFWDRVYRSMATQPEDEAASPERTDHA